MNHLVHLFLSDPEPLCRLGNLAGDYVKGPLDDRWHPALRRGLRQHRQVDLFAQRSPAFRRSRQRLDPALGHYRGILVDVFWDHLLARNWPCHARRPLADFAREIYRDIETHCDLLPSAFRQAAPAMIARDWLTAGADPASVPRILNRLAARLSRPVDLAAGARELDRHEEALQRDCTAFLDAACRHFQGSGLPRS